ncbi:MAG: class I SAM-dependent methyltransferase, partial [Candidatus Heimdallarchaeota archaeon]|nr:class I SAM-dependent methyltransferase [Candidatus Heimdallarchaeota archaeon]
HIPKDQISVFLRRLHSTLKMKSVVFIADNVYVADRGGKLIQDYLRSNTYKIRKLKNMTRHVILKNYYHMADLLRIFSKFDSNFNEENISFGERYWHLHYYLDKI